MNFHTATAVGCSLRSALRSEHPLVGTGDAWAPPRTNPSTRRAVGIGSVETNADGCLLSAISTFASKYTDRIYANYTKCTL